MIDSRTPTKQVPPLLPHAKVKLPSEPLLTDQVGVGRVSARTFTEARREVRSLPQIAGLSLTNVTIDEYLAEMPAHNGLNPGAVDASVSNPRHSVHLRRRGNLLVPLLRLPTELILKIFAHAIESKGNGDHDHDDWANYDDDDDDDHHHHHHHLDIPLLVLTAICHQLREIGTASPQLWNTVDFTTPSIAKLFLKRCEYNPRIILVKDSTKYRSPQGAPNPKRGAVWEKLEGRTLGNLRSLVFHGTPDEFAHRVVGVLRRAPNVSNLDIYNFSFSSSEELPWPRSDPIPNLSILHLRLFWITWASPLLQNLSQLSLDLSEFPHISSESTPIEMFLTALANCPGLEILNLAHAGPDPLNGHQDKCDVIVQLRRLQEFSLEFRDPSTIGYILSHIEYPEATELAVFISVDQYADLSETIPLALPPRNAQTTQHFRKSKALTVCLGNSPYFRTENLLVRFPERCLRTAPARSPQEMTQLVSKIVEVVGGDTIISLNVRSLDFDFPDGTWETLLHGIPRLEQICYSHCFWERDRDLVNPFVLAFSRPFEGGPVCTQLQHLELPRTVLTQHSSIPVLKLALTERDVCGRRLRRIGITGAGSAMQPVNWLVLAPFRDLVDKVG